MQKHYKNLARPVRSFGLRKIEIFFYFQYNDNYFAHILCIFSKPYFRNFAELEKRSKIRMANMSELKVKNDVLQIMISNCDLQGSELFDLIIGKSNFSSTQGYLYETLCIILISLKCFQLDYKEILV